MIKVNRLKYGSVLILAGIILLLDSCMTFRTPDQKVEKYFQKQGVEVSVRRHQFEGKTFRYLDSGNGQQSEEDPLIVFVHGAPGSSNNFHQYLSDTVLRQKARMISVDRLGYGYSDYGKSEISLDTQARLIRHVMDIYPSEKVVLVGHSYGGPIVGKCAMDYSNDLEAIVMLAPVNDPENEKMFWFAKFARWKATKWMLSGALKVSGDEKFSHVAELDKIASGWQDINIPVVHIHGQKDKIAPVANIDFSVNNINPDYLKMIVVPETSHFIPWSDYHLVREELLFILSRQTTTSAY